MVIVGTNYLNSGGSSYGVYQIIIHEAYNKDRNANNIAVLRLYGSIGYNARVQPISLSDTAAPNGAFATFIGWGFTRNAAQEYSNSLQHVALTTLTLAQCQSYLPGYPIDGTNVCAFEGRGYGACNGDSGGPLIFAGRQIGLLSWGIPCAVDKPDVFTSISSYRSWINYHTGV